MKNVANVIVNDMRDINHLLNTIMELYKGDIGKQELKRIESSIKKIKKILGVYINE